MKYISIRPVFFSYIFLIFFTSDTWAFRCGTSIVKEQDTVEEVRKDCGEPTKELQQTITYRAEQGSMKRERYSEWMIWIYVFGNNDFVQILQFENNVLKYIDHSRYGREYEGNREACKGPVFSATSGMWAPEIILLCGEPDKKKLVERSVNPYDEDANITYSRESVFEAWRYDFPDSQKSALLKFENGRLTWISWKDSDDIRW